MHEFDLIVIGAGSGLNVASAAASRGLSVAVVEEGPMGGTCLNRGCIPSKVIIHSANIAEEINRSHLFGIVSSIKKINFAEITKRASAEVDKEAREIENGIKATKNMTLFKNRGRFVGERTLAVGSKQIKGRKVVVAAGTRTTIPPIEGINDVKYITSDEALRLREQPKSMVVIGGSFIAAELAHFFGALGTKVTILQRSIMLRNEDREIAEAFTKIFGRKHKIILGYNPESVRQKGSKITITASNGKKEIKLDADSLLIATGRTPNTDILDVSKGRIETDERGYIKVNQYLETSARSTWALGDIAGKYLLKHSANLEAKYVINNMLHEKKPVDYWPMPHAIFTNPQIAAVGFTEEELKEKKIDYAVGRCHYKDTGMGLALQEKDGFVKILAGRRTRKILGCHIIGPDASSIIHEVIVAMKLGATADHLASAVHIHPAMSEVVQRAALRIEW
jgi:mycothione reductase